MNFPIANSLRKKWQLDMATFQDTVTEILYRTDERIVLHGGTAIWRCFHGNRFSDDIDAYVGAKTDLEKLKRDMLVAASERSVKVEKIKDTGNLLFMAFSLGGAYMKVEINHRKGHLAPISMGFERVDGTRMEVLTLSPDELMLEKIAAYSDRRFIRDIYDIYFLGDYVDRKRVRKAVLDFISNIEPPVNEKELSGLVYMGVTPTFKGMVERIRARFS